MKRSPLKRGKGLARTGGLKRTGRLQYRSKKTQEKYDKERIPLVAAQLEAQPWCQLDFPGCWGKATCVDELKSRGRGGSITNTANCVSACVPCNGYKEDHPAEAHARGVALHFWEAEPDGGSPSPVTGGVR